MINTLAALFTTAVIVVVYWLGFEFGFLTNRESVLVGAVVVLVFHVLRDQGRILDLERIVKEDRR